MADEKEAPTGPKLEEITANKLKISHGSLDAGNISFQLRNIASLHITQHDDNHERWDNAVAAAFVISLIWAVIAGGTIYNMKMSYAFGVWLVAIIAVFFTVLYFAKSKHVTWFQLAILTNAASSYRWSVFGKTVEDASTFAFRVKSILEEAMKAPDAATYNINRTEMTVDKIEANTTTVSHSPGANTIGGNASQVNQTSNVVAISQGLQDISALIGLVEASNTANAAMMKAYLETVRSNLAGGSRSKEEAKSAWASFVDQAGSLAQTGTNVWDLVARVGSLFAG